MTFEKGNKINLGRYKSIEVRRKISDTIKNGYENGRKKYWLGKKRPEISGELHPLYGVGHIEKTKDKMSKTKKILYAEGKLKIWNKKYKSNKLWKKVRGTRPHYKVWCSQPENLPFVPKGFIIHHIDGNPLNNFPDNLFLVDDSSHKKIHNEIMKQSLLGGNCRG